MFSMALLFLCACLTVTVVTNTLNQVDGQMASVANFANVTGEMGAEAVTDSVDHQGNIDRLKGKIAAGEGDVRAGEPIFTSVDDITPSDDEPALTDQSPAPTAVQIGTTVDGQALMSSDLWRFVGYSHLEQIGTALNGTPFYGARLDAAPLDQCGGYDDGLGYKLYLKPGTLQASSCFGA